MTAALRHASWRKALRDGLVTGTIASLLSSLALAASGRRELKDAAAPMNGPSQWLWGGAAPYRNGFSGRYTVTGYLIHHAMSIFWAVLYEKWRRARPGEYARQALFPAIATSAAACFVDYRLTPPRFTPGFEKRLSRRSLLLVYALFAAGLAAGSLVRGAPPPR